MIQPSETVQLRTAGEWSFQAERRYEAANAHIIASLPSGLTVEVDPTGNPFIDDLLVEPIVVRDGLLAIPDSPGLGIELNMDTVDRLRVPTGTTVGDGNYSDFLWGARHLAPPSPYQSIEIDA